MNANIHTRTDTGEKDFQFATTLSRGIDILQSFRVGESTLGNKDFVERTGLSKTTVARLTHTLVALGYLRHDEALGKYRLGASVVAMSYPLLASMQLRQIARPLMKRLANHIRGAVSLGIRDRTQMVYVETMRSTDSLVMTPDIGATIPIMTTAIGKAWLCKAPAEEREAVLNRIRVADPAQFDRDYGGILQAKKTFERNGYCANRDEWRKDVYGFAVPLDKPVDSTLFVFNCGILARPGQFSEIEREVAPLLVSLVRSTEVLLGLR
jgi:DNA-binding IclR family transcriptional regulator